MAPNRTRQVAGHAMASYVRMGLGVVVSLAITRATFAALEAQGFDVGAKAAFGVFTLLVSISGVSGFLQEASMGALIRELARRLEGPRQALEEAFSTGFALASFNGAMRGLVLFLLAPWLPVWFNTPASLLPQARTGLALLALNQVLVSPARTWYAVRLAEERFSLEFARVFVGQLLRLALVLAAPSLPIGILPGLVLAWCLPDLLTTNALALWDAWRDPRWRPHGRSVRRREIGHLASLSGWGAVSTMAENFFSRTDQVISTALLGPAATGLYAIADQLRSQTANFSLVANSVLLPAASKAAAGGAKSLRKVYIRATRATVALAGGPCALLFVFAGPFIARWLGEGQAEAYVALRWAMFLLLLRLPLITAGTVFTAAGRLRPPALALVSEGFFNQGLSLLFLMAWHWGLSGIYMGTAIAAVVRLAFVHLPQLEKVFGGDRLSLVREAWFLPWAGSLALGLGAYALSQVLGPLPLAAGVALLAALYGAWCWRVILDEAERQALWQAVARRAHGR